MGRGFGLISWAAVGSRRCELIRVNHEQFKEAIRAKITTPSQNNWDVPASGGTTKPVAIGDAILVTFYFRTLGFQTRAATGNRTQLRTRPRPLDQGQDVSVRAGHEWQKFSVPFIADQELKAGRRSWCFAWGTRPRPSTLRCDHGKLRHAASAR
jgi:hypothetical protein